MGMTRPHVMKVNNITNKQTKLFNVISSLQIKSHYPLLSSKLLTTGAFDWRSGVKAFQDSHLMLSKGLIELIFFTKIQQPLDSSHPTHGICCLLIKSCC